MGFQRLFLLSANSPQSLAGTAARPADWHEGGGARTALDDVAHALALRRWRKDPLMVPG
jgi:acyl transferase domain-containing protein